MESALQIIFKISPSKLFTKYERLIKKDKMTHLNILVQVHLRENMKINRKIQVE